MRSFLVGFILLSLSAGSALAQATGEVRALGFQGYYRPDCWTALKVHLKSTLSTPAEYQIQVHQQDLDKDTVVYTSNVPLNPQGEQDYWVYFVPQPVGKREEFGGGLPSQRAALNQVLKVHLYDKSGKTQIASLPVTFNITNIEPYRGQGAFGATRGTKLILCVIERDKPAWQDYVQARGLMEDVIFLPVTPSDLPDSPLGYQAVDSIVWFDANAEEITGYRNTTVEAIRQYVSHGGQLVVCQPTSKDAFGRIEPFADLLPVVLKEQGEWAVQVASKPGLQPLVRLARQRRGSQIGGLDQWGLLAGSRPEWDMARARAKPDAVVDETIRWDKPEEKDEERADPNADRTPYIARRAYDMGSVVWVAQDLGSPNLMTAQVPDPYDFRPVEARRRVMVASSGWPHVWDAVFGWRNETYTDAEVKYEAAQPGNSETAQRRYGEGTVVDLGGSLLKGMEHTARGAAYIFLAVVFFIGYWVVAGPGSFAFLASRRKKGLSWIAFALAAFVATALTVGVVKLVLRGDPEVRHVSLVRLSPADPGPDGLPRYSATINSRFGLYIPRDGEQRVVLTPTTAGRVSYLIPFAIHLQHLAEDTGFTDTAKYVVNTDQFTGGGGVEVYFPYRSTNKRLEGQWTGTVEQGIEGKAALAPPGLVKNPRTGLNTGTITGILTNRTGRDLNDVYFAFRSERLDLLLFVPSWPKDADLDLEVEYNRADNINQVSELGRTKPTRGQLDSESWGRFWYRNLNPGGIDIQHDDSGSNFERSFPLMAFFDRVGPQRGVSSEGWKRYELLRRGGRALDVSSLVACGQLVILAQTSREAPLPLPLNVDEDRVGGEGVVLYEIAVPLDETGLDKPPATQPAQPATQPAVRPATRPVAAGPASPR